MPEPTPPHITAPVIAVIKLTSNLVSAVYEYLWGCGTVLDDLQKLIDELQSLGKVLAGLRNYSPQDQEFQSSIFQKLNTQNGPLFACAAELSRLQQDMDSDKGTGEDTRGLGWLLNEKQLLPYISRIAKHKNVLALALQLIKDQSQLMEVMVGYTQKVDSRIKLRSYLPVYDPHSQAAEIAKERKNDLDWLYEGDFDGRYLEIQERRLEGTGEWLFRSPIFQNWMEAKPNFLLVWGRAIAGSGKTFISSKIIDHIKAQSKINNYGVAYIFFDRMDPGERLPKDVISCLIKQLVCQTRNFSFTSRILFSRLRESQLEPNSEKLCRNLIETAKLFDRVFLVFDGLDEYDKRNDLLLLVHILAQEKISIFITSGLQSSDIQRSLHTTAKMDLSLRAEDIRTYVLYRTCSNPRIKRLLQQGKILERFISELSACANGMFLFVHLLMQSLVQHPTAKHMFKELEQLKTLTRGENCYMPLYRTIIGNICHQKESSASMALKILSWLVKAQRVLTVAELREAVSVEDGRYELEGIDLLDKETMVDLCAGLVTVDQSGNKVRLIHYTAKDFLEKGHMLPPDAEYQVAMACITYISFDDFSQGPWHDSWVLGRSWEDRMKIHPFYEYAAIYLSTHINSCDPSLTTKAFLRFTKNPGQMACYLYLLKDYPPPEIKDISPLHVSALIGHLPVVRLFVQKGRDPFLTDHDGRTALLQAVRGNHREIVQLLLEDGRAKQSISKPWECTELSVRDQQGKTVLHWAARKGFRDIVKLLLENGVDVSECGNGGQTALHEAARGGHEDVVQLLLENGVPAWSREELEQTALHVAVMEGHEGITKRILEHCHSVSSRGRGRATTRNLENARRDDDLVVKDLFDLGTGFHQYYTYHTPLNLAAWGGHIEIVRLLLQAGADVSVRDTDSETALHLAARGGDKGTAQLLLDYGADISAKTRDGVTVLHRAATRGYTDVIKILLYNGADISTRLGSRTALRLSLINGHEQAARLLLEKSAETSITSEADNMLVEAATGGCSSVVELLLDRGTRISSTVLYTAAENGHKDVVKILLSYGADILLHVEGQTALHVASYNGHEDVVKILLQNGADISAQDEDQKTALHKAAYGSKYKGNAAVVCLLLEAGADILAQDKLGETALILAAGGGPLEVTQILIANGADITKRNIYGSTALHRAVSRGHIEIVRFLLDHENDNLTRTQNLQQALFISADTFRGEITRLLIDRGADITERNKEGKTAFMVAVENCRPQIVQVILQCGADITEKNGDGETAFFVAAGMGYSEVVRLLLENGARLSEKNAEGHTALFVAAGKGHLEVVEFLIKKGANISETNADGQTALFVAAAGGYRKVFQLLIEKGANEYARDRSGKMAFIEEEEEYDDYDPTEPWEPDGW